MSRALRRFSLQRGPITVDEPSSQHDDEWDSDSEQSEERTAWSLPAELPADEEAGEQSSIRRVRHIDQTLDALSQNECTVCEDRNLVMAVSRFYRNLVMAKWHRLSNGQLAAERRNGALERSAKYLSLEEVALLHRTSRRLRVMPRSEFPWGQVLKTLNRQWPEDGDWGRPLTCEKGQSSFCTVLRTAEATSPAFRASQVTLL